MLICLLWTSQQLKSQQTKFDSKLNDIQRQVNLETDSLKNANEKFALLDEKIKNMIQETFMLKIAIGGLILGGSILSMIAFK